MFYLIEQEAKCYIQLCSTLYFIEHSVYFDGQSVCIQYIHWPKRTLYVSHSLSQTLHENACTTSSFHLNSQRQSISPTNCVTSTILVFDSLLERFASSICVIATVKSQQKILWKSWHLWKFLVGIICVFCNMKFDTSLRAFWEIKKFSTMKCSNETTLFVSNHSALGVCVPNFLQVIFLFGFGKAFLLRSIS